MVDIALGKEMDRCGVGFSFYMKRSPIKNQISDRYMAKAGFSRDPTKA